MGLKANINASNIQLNLSSNGFGSAGAAILEGALAEDTKITQLDISDNGFDGDLVSVIKGLSQNLSLKKVWLGQNFQNNKVKNLSSVLNSLSMLLQSENTQIKFLSLAHSKLKSETANIINALGANTSLEEIDLSGNLMGNEGAYALAKALQLNNTLKAVFWDGNNTSPQGFHVVSIALEKNFSLTKMPVPVNDAGAALKIDQDKTQKALQKIEDMLQRNHSPQRFVSNSSYRICQGFLANSSQQIMDKHIVAIRSLIDQLNNNDCSDDVKNDVEKAKNILMDSEKSLQIIMKCQEVAVKSEQSGEIMETKLKTIAQDIHKTLSELLQNNVADMLNAATDLCPVILQEENVKESMKESCALKSVIPEKLVEALLCEQVATDLMNKLSERNLSVSTTISEHLMDKVVNALDKTRSSLNNYLMSIQNPIEVKEQRERMFLRRQPSEDKSAKFNIERILTAKIRPTTSVFGLINEDQDENSDSSDVDAKDSPDGIPSTNKPSAVEIQTTLVKLESEERQLQHLSKSRPKQRKTQIATLTVRRPKDDELTNLYEEIDVRPSAGQDELSNAAVNIDNKTNNDSKTQIQFDMQPKVNATEESKANKLENKKSSDTTESEDNKQKISTDEAPEYATVKPRIPAGGAKLPGMGGMMGGALLAEMKAKHKSIHPLSEGSKTEKLTADKSEKLIQQPTQEKEKIFKITLGKQPAENKQADEKSEKQLELTDKSSSEKRGSFENKSKSELSEKSDKAGITNKISNNMKFPKGDTDQSVGKRIGDKLIGNSDAFSNKPSEVSGQPASLLRSRPPTVAPKPRVGSTIVENDVITTTSSTPQPTASALQTTVSQSSSIIASRSIPSVATATNTVSHLSTTSSRNQSGSSNVTTTSASNVFSVPRSAINVSHSSDILLSSSSSTSSTLASSLPTSTTAKQSVLGVPSPSMTNTKPVSPKPARAIGRRDDNFQSNIGKNSSHKKDESKHDSADDDFEIAM